MRKLVLLTIGLLFCGTIQAQISKGDVQLGGSISWNNVDNGPTKISIFDVQPNVGKFVSDRTSLGLIVGYNAVTRDVMVNNNIFELNDNRFEYGVYARFHKPIGEKFYFYLQPSVVLGTGEDQFDTTNTLDIELFAIRIIPGITYFLNEKWALEMRFGNILYRKEKASGAFNRDTDQFTLNMGLSNVGIGMSFYLK